MKEFIDLLEKFWILKNSEPELYYSIKDNFSELSSFAKDKLGCRLILKPDFIKLEKIPARAEIWMGLPGFEEPLDYALLCFVLMFLEKKGKGDQFILSQLTESILINSAGICKPDWTLYRHRKALVRVLKYTAAIGMINVYDGDSGRFADDAETEVLYESSGLSRYFARMFIKPLTQKTSIEDIENETYLDIEHDRGDYRRHRVYRKLVFTPAIYSTENADFDYIKNFRGFISRDIEKMTGCRLDIHRTAAAMIVPGSSRYKRVFPSQRAISDIALQLNRILRSGAGDIPPSETFSMSYSEFYGIVLKLMRESRSGWSKEYREKSADEITDELILYMQGFSLLRRDGDTITILPLAGKITGDYPKDYDRRTGRRNE
ncbi:MAG TPA: TIGR02678 family protein [Candidatus Ornithomonoglobus merdipullorum]|uniref:TIGR02678 family protein n=1 Tax=Candidatus Ornithomonoglobus merdipullorum TaxID=2840895 RepID=A0A9D1MAU3_9FIRM|nr:TIGR02678 family protein [Candidatus Ornithomonoglobus merdipullorum]